MHPKTTSTNLPFIFLAIVLFVLFSHHLYHDARTAITTTLLLSSSSSSSSSPSSPPPPFPPPPLPPPPFPPLPSPPPPSPSSSHDQIPSIIFTADAPPSHAPYGAIPDDPSSFSSPIAAVSVLIPGWQVLVILLSRRLILDHHNDSYACVFRNSAITPAIFERRLPFTDRITFKCEIPPAARRRLPFFQPILTKSPPPPGLKENAVAISAELLRWNFLVYESFTTEDDVVLFVKGVNNRQGVNRPPTDFHCVFGSEDTAVRTATSTSIQEVFRCPLPDDQEPRNSKVSLEINSEEIGAKRVPSVAQYTELPTVDFQESKSLVCACTMVYNVAKFLKEWVLYHSRIGVERFILYDNESDDDLRRVIDELAGEGYDVRYLFWIWPKAQEAGFSHCALFARQICTWMIYIDVDEFIFSPSWLESASPSSDMLKSLLLPRPPHGATVGQVSIKCNDFGPSDQAVHPIEGVTQGYTCRRRMEQRHKSMVLLEAIDESLMNAIHHFQLKEGYRTKAVGMHRAVVNHYKYQAWPEFKAKFRRRVSAYVVDWRQNLNLLSKDRTPGLGSEPVEPVGWAEMFCEVEDRRLRRLARRWFGVETANGTLMPWQR
ncbi:hypothetical protein Dimus_034494 [Dionaea muscipula]